LCKWHHLIQISTGHHEKNHLAPEVEGPYGSASLAPLRDLEVRLVKIGRKLEGSAQDFDPVVRLLPRPANVLGAELTSPGRAPYRCATENKIG